MGTGGGEVLLDLSDALPADTVATEGWPPNVPVAANALASFGVGVVFYDAETDPVMPFPDGRFDLVLNRHEAFVAEQVHRVLQPGGWFLTQQVDGRSFDETQQLFGGTSRYRHVTLPNMRREIEDAGLAVERADDWVGALTFASISAMVRYFAIVPWEVPEDFSVDRHADVLLGLHHSSTELRFTQRRFVVAARA